MAQNTRYNCDRCGESVYLKFSDGQRVPLVCYLVVSQPPDTGPRIDLATVKVPAVVRELMALPTPRIELCVICFAEVLGLPMTKPLTEADQQAMLVTHPKFGAQQVAPAVARIADLEQANPNATDAEVNVVMKSDVMYALKHGKHPTPAGRKRAARAATTQAAKGAKRVARASAAAGDSTTK